MREKTAMKIFLETYKFLPCLWDPRDKFYLNKEARSQALEILVEKYKAVDSEASVELVKKKLENMRCAYKREYKKVLISRNESDNPADEYKPTLWYYKYLLFLNEKQDESADITKTSYSSGEEEDGPIYFEPSSPPAAKKRKTSNNNSAVYIIEKEEPQMHSSNFDSFASPDESHKEAEYFGKTVGLQLKKLDDMQRHIAEKLISEVIYYGRLNQLNTRACINLNEDFS